MPSPETVKLYRRWQTLVSKGYGTLTHRDDLRKVDIRIRRARDRYDVALRLEQGKVTPLSCDMRRECTAPVAYLDAKGYVYCERHGIDRQSVQPCRRLTRTELDRLRTGLTLERY